MARKNISAKPDQPCNKPDLFLRDTGEHIELIISKKLLKRLIVITTTAPPLLWGAAKFIIRYWAQLEVILQDSLK